MAQFLPFSVLFYLFIYYFYIQLVFLASLTKPMVALIFLNIDIFKSRDICNLYTIFLLNHCIKFQGTYSTQIFSLAVLLSSLFIYNQVVKLLFPIFFKMN